MATIIGLCGDLVARGEPRARASQLVETKLSEQMDELRVNDCGCCVVVTERDVYSHSV